MRRYIPSRAVNHKEPFWVQALGIVRFSVSKIIITNSVSEIKLLGCALAGCTSHKTVHPEIAPCTLQIYSNNKWLKKRAHTGCTPPKIVHPVCRVHP